MDQQAISRGLVAWNMNVQGCFAERVRKPDESGGTLPASSEREIDGKKLLR